MADENNDIKLNIQWFDTFEIDCSDKQPTGTITPLRFVYLRYNYDAATGVGSPILDHTYDADIDIVDDDGDVGPHQMSDQDTTPYTCPPSYGRATSDKAR